MSTMGLGSLRVGRPKPNSILVIEDEYSMSEFITHLLEVEGYKVKTAFTQEDAFRSLRDQRPDLIITDMRLPEREGMMFEPDALEAGINIIRFVRNDKRLASIPIIVMSPFVETSPYDVIAEGANALLSKTIVYSQPILTDRLLEKINELLTASKEIPDSKPDVDLIIPVTHSITVINERLLELFQKDPESLHRISSREFEQVIAELFAEEGYEVAITPESRDGGKDIYVYKKDPLTETMFLVECKRYTPPNTVGVEIARQLYGVVQHERASGGILVTTSYFTKPAQEFAKSIPYQLFLRDFEYLTKWLKKADPPGKPS